MTEIIPEGIWPTMITPFKQTNEIDYEALEELIEWYIANKVNGLFAVCQSSEMFFLSLKERVKLATYITKKVAGRIPVIASGHISSSFENQVREINLIAETGVTAVVLITNRLAGPDETEEIWYKNLERLLMEIPQETKLGLYECPFPYKRIMSPALLKRCSETGRFLFLKDTCCDNGLIREKIKSTEGSGLKVFNANTATLLTSLIDGAAGYSGVMANFHPAFYRWLVDNWDKKPEEARLLADFLTMASLIEAQHYPVNAKYHLKLEGLNIGLFSRSRSCSEFPGLFRLEVEELYELEKAVSMRLKQI